MCKVLNLGFLIFAQIREDSRRMIDRLEGFVVGAVKLLGKVAAKEKEEAEINSCVMVFEV